MIGIKKLSIYLGYFFLALGILGFIPGITYNGYLLGIFHVNWFHNLVHLVTGAAFLWAGKSSDCYALRAFQVFTIIYGLVTLSGLLGYHALMLGPMAMNFADTLFHAAVTGVSLYFGFLSPMRLGITCTQRQYVGSERI